MNKMQGAIIIGGKRQVELKDFPVPEPGPGQVLLRMKAAGMCGSDLHNIYRTMNLDVGKSDGTETGNEGDDDRAGDKGQIDGDPYAPSYFGQPGTGSGGVGYGLNGRGRPTKKKFVPDCDEEGRVVVEVHVDRGGRVVNAVPGKRGTTGAYCLYDAAKKTALSYKWPADSKAPSKQIGFVVVNFTVTQ